MWTIKDLKGKVCILSDLDENRPTHAIQVLGTYDFGNMKLQDVAVTPDCTRLLGVGPLLESPNGLRPSKSRAEKRLTGQ